MLLNMQMSIREKNKEKMLMLLMSHYTHLGFTQLLAFEKTRFICDIHTYAFVCVHWCTSLSLCLMHVYTAGSIQHVATGYLL